MSEKSVGQSVGSAIVNEMNALSFGESVTINLSDLIRKHLAQVDWDKEMEKMQSKDEYSPFNTVNS